MDIRDDHGNQPTDKRSDIWYQFCSSGNERQRSFLRNIHAKERKDPQCQQDSESDEDAQEKLRFQSDTKPFVYPFQSHIDEFVFLLASQS